jgi:hypothetical protein
MFYFKYFLLPGISIKGFDIYVHNMFYLCFVLGYLIKPFIAISVCKTLLRPLAGYTLYDHKTNDHIRRELRITGILDKIDEYRRNWLSHLQKECHKTESV